MHKKEIKKAGFRIEKLTYVNTILFPLDSIKRLTESKEPKSELNLPPKIVNKLFTNNLNGLLEKINHIACNNKVIMK